MKKIILFSTLVAIAAIAGVVRSHSNVLGCMREWPKVISRNPQPAGEVREEIRKNFELAPGARVEVSGINGTVKIETSDTTTAHVFVERAGASAEALHRRKVIVENNAGGLTIRTEKADGSFISRMFGSNPTERVLLRLPKAIHLIAKGINGSVTAGEMTGSVEVKGVNGRVDIAQASGSAKFNGINGNIAVALQQLDKEGIELSGINGNIDLRLGDGTNAELETHGMNGRVVSDSADVVVGSSHHGRYTARIGNGGNKISASGINGNIRLSRMTTPRD